MNLDFEDKILVLSGGTGGIGRATVEFFLERGANVCIGDLEQRNVDAMVQEFERFGERVVGTVVDVSKSVSCNKFVQFAVARYGSIDYLVPAAGIYRDAMVCSMTDEQWQQMHAVTSDGVFFLCRAAIPHINKHGAIVNIASLAGHRGSFEHAHYAAAKAAVLGLTRSLAAELAPDIRVNAISPGLIDTGLVQSLLDRIGDAMERATPLKRAGHPSEVASVIAFLCSSWASFVTGETVHVNGGFNMAS